MQVVPVHFQKLVTFYGTCSWTVTSFSCHSKGSGTTNIQIWLMKHSFAVCWVLTLPSGEHQIFKKNTGKLEVVPQF